MHVIPIAEPLKQQTILAAPQPQSTPRPDAHGGVGAPEFGDADEIGTRILVRNLRIGARVLGISAEARIGDAEEGDDSGKFCDRAEPLAFEQSAAQANIQGEGRHGSPERGDAMFCVERLKFLQQPISIGQRASVRRIQKIESFHLAQAIGSHA
jgi:hypothetical protein